MGEYKFERTFKSDIFEVKPVITEALDYIKSMLPDISEDNEYELKLVFSELLFNSVIHGNRQDGIRNVYIGLKVESGTVIALVSDEGRGYDYSGLIDSFGKNENLMGENGRGMKLVYTLTDELEFNIKGNSVKFRKKVFFDG